MRFGEHGFTLPFGTEHQGRCKYSPTKGLCPLPTDCPKSSRLVKSVNDLCHEIPNVEKTYVVKA